MIATLLMIAGMLFLALQREEMLEVPSPPGLISLSFLARQVRCHRIMSPPYCAMRDGNASTVSLTLSTRGYRAPASRVGTP